ncbi:putative Acyl-CoA thioesterase [Azospirillaceae bacterium]
MFTYDYSWTVTLGSTSAMENLYFAEYFRIQGIVREMWAVEHIDGLATILRGGLIMSTKEANCRYIKPFFLYDKAVCKMSFRKLRRVSVDVVFEFYNAELPDLYACGFQTLVFKDSNRKTCRMPEEFRPAIKKFLWE